MLGMSQARAFKGIVKPLFDEGYNVSQPKVEIYTKMWCGLLLSAPSGCSIPRASTTPSTTSRSAAEKRAEMLERKPDAYTVPQIFIDGAARWADRTTSPALDREGKLDSHARG